MGKVTIIPQKINPITQMAHGVIKKRKVAAYARVSTESEEQATSYEAQVNYYSSYIKEKPNWEYVDVYSDEGITGTNTKRREGFNRMIKDALDGKIDYIISTSSKGKLPTRDSVKIRRKAVERSIPCLTSIDTANAVANCLMSRYSEYNTELVDINKLRKGKQSHKFVKMHSAGNDRIFFDCLDGVTIDNPEGVAVRMSDRHFGVGAEGIVLIEKSDVADAKMRIFNCDGSQGMVCGNGLFGVAKYLYDNRKVNKYDITIETPTGIRDINIKTQDGEATYMTVNMGSPILKPAQIPVKLAGKNAIGVPYTIDGKEYMLNVVSMGNPHCVLFVEHLDNIDISKLGSQLEYDSIFPNRTNVEFAKVIDGRTVKARIWDKGCGETFASGSGSCAVVVSAVLNGYLPKDTDITVKQNGGEMVVRYTDEGVLLKGTSVEVFSGIIEF